MNPWFSSYKRSSPTKPLRPDSGLSLLLTTLLWLFVGVGFSWSAGLEITLSPEGGGTVETGNAKHINVTYNWPSLTEDLTNAKITIPLPAEFDPAGVELRNSAHVASSAFDSGSRLITYTMINPLPAGSSGTFQFCVRFPNGTTANGATGTLTATASADGKPSNDAPVTLTATATDKVELSKQIGADPALDQKATYLINVRNSKGGGNYNLSGTTITDTLPAGATFVSASNGGTESGGVVTWNLGTVDVNTDLTLRVTVIFPSGSFTLGQEVTNNVSLAATGPGGAPITRTAEKKSPISPPNPQGSSYKSANDAISSLKASEGYYIAVNNSGNVELTDYIIEDFFPKEFIPNSFYVGSDDAGAETAIVNVEYQTTQNSTWRTAPGSPFTCAPGTDKYVGVWEMGLNTGEIVTAIRYTYPTVPVGYNTSWRSRIWGNIGDSTTGLDRDGNAIAPLPRDPVTNTATVKWTFNGNTTANTYTADTKIIEPSPKPQIGKYMSPGSVQPGDIVDVGCSLGNNNGSAPLPDPVFADLLPAEVDFVPDSFTSSAPLDSGGTLEVIPNYSGTGRTLVRSKWPGKSVENWQTSYINFKVKVKPGTPVGTYKNFCHLASTSATSVNPERVSTPGPDTNDLDGDGNTTETIWGSYEASFNCIRYAAIDSIKWVKGELDADFHKYPDKGRTTANGTFQYKIIISNPGNVPMTDIRLMDILPYVGDVGVKLTDATRDTEYTPFLTGPVTVPAGITVKYSTSRNPVRSDLDPSLGDPTSGTGAFSTTPPGDIRTVGTLLFDLGSIVLAPLESREITWTMRAPMSVVPGQVAWNSFAHRSTATDGGPPPPPSEPIKVGVTVPVEGAAKIGNFVWYDANGNGVQDSGESGASGVTVTLCDAAGAPVLDALGNPVTTTTDGSGNYAFGVPAGTYSVKFTIPAGYVASPKETTANGGTEANDSDAAPNGKTGTVTVALGAENLDLDLGLVVPANPVASLGNLVFCDTNNDGLHDADGADNTPGNADDEPGISGVTLALCDAAGAPVDDPNQTGTQNYTTVTDSNGAYLFSGLAAGSYTVKIATPPATKPNSSTPTDTADNQEDGDDNGAQTTPGGAITSPVIVLSSGENDLTVDFGLVSPPPAAASLGNLVFCDTNKDGVRDADGADNTANTADDEPGIQGVVVSLCAADGTTPIDNPNLAGVQAYVSTTDENGLYSFNGLAAGSYTVKIATPPATKPDSSPNGVTDTADNNEDDDDNGTQATSGGAITSPVIALIAGETDNTVDFGLVAPPGAALGNLVFCDTNKDGLRDADGVDNIAGNADDEPGIAGVVVSLCAADGTTAIDNPHIAGTQPYTSTTDAAGLYAFTGLAAGSYTVKIATPPASKPDSSPAGVTDTADNQQDDDDNGSQSASGGPITSPVITLVAGETDDTVDFGLVAPPQLVSLGNLVFNDKDGDGKFEPNGNDNLGGTTGDNEAGIAGVVVELWRSTDAIIGNGDDVKVLVGSDGNLATPDDSQPYATDSSGCYRFTGLAPGTYYVKIPASEFATGEPLVGMLSSPGAAGDIQKDDSTDENGIDSSIPATNGITSGLIALANDAEPIDGAGAEDGKSPTSDNTDDNNGDMTVDFGFCGPVSVGDLVWLDDGDGVKESGESGLPGAKLKLLDTTGAIVVRGLGSGAQEVPAVPTSTSTGVVRVDGALNTTTNTLALKISFGGLAGNVTMAHLHTGVAGVSGGVAVDLASISFPTGVKSGSVTGSVSLTSTQVTDLLDNKLYLNIHTSVVGGGEVRAQLEACETTGSLGDYLFDNLKPGDYVLRVTPPGGQTPATTQVADPDTPGETDSNFDLGRTPPVGGYESGVFTLTSGEEIGDGDANPNNNPSVDFALVAPSVTVALGNLVFCDVDGDGKADAGEGVDGVLVEVRKASDNSLAGTDLTSGGGRWLVYGLTSGTAYYAQIPASEFAASKPLQGKLSLPSTQAGDDNAGEDGIDAPNPASTGIKTANVTVTAGSAPLDAAETGQGPADDNTTPGDNNGDMTIDFGLYAPLGALGNYVWLDENSDGKQDEGEPGIPNITVILCAANGITELARTTTDAHGGYLFDELPAGAYVVKIATPSLPAGLTQTPTDGTSSDFGNKPQAGYSVTLGGGQPMENLTADFGYNWNPTTDVDNNTNTAALGDKVWFDADQDGRKDPEEVGIAGVVVELVTPGPDGLYHTPDDVFGLGADGDVGGTGINADIPSMVAVTDALGCYHFDNLPPGSYCVKAPLNPNYGGNEPLNGAVQTGDPDHFGTTGAQNDGETTVPVILGPGDVFLNADFGYFKPGLGTIGDTVWFDANGSGTATQDAGEPGIPGVTVALVKDTNGNGLCDPGEPIIATDTTDADGKYLFVGLPLDDGDGDADYVVAITDTDNVLAGLAQSYDQDSPLDDKSATALSAGTPNDLAQDFSYEVPGQAPGEGLIGDTIYLDFNGDGDQDPGEPGLEGVVVKLCDDGADNNPSTAGDNQVIAIAVTDENGRYSFGNLPLGQDYVVKVDTTTLPPGLTNTDDPDTTGTGDSQSIVTNLEVGTPINLVQDFGYQGTLRVGNLVWLDVNADGDYDAATETPIGGVTLDLYRDLNGNDRVDPGEPLIASTTTASTINAGVNGADGNYCFPGLPPGDYVVDVTDEAGLLVGYWHSRGTDDTNNHSQADPYDLTLGGADNKTADFGYYLQPASVGDFVWRDNDASNTQTSGDTGLNGVTVSLCILYPDGTQIVLYTKTGDNPNTVPVESGWYSFGNLLLDEDFNGVGALFGAGGDEPKHTVKVATPPAGMNPVAQNVGGNEALDSDNPVGDDAQPVEGSSDLTKDFGYSVSPLLAVGNLVFLDLDADGVYTLGVDEPLDNVTVEAFLDVNTDGQPDNPGSPVASDVSDASGCYLITGLAPGNYVLRIPASEFNAGGDLVDFRSVTGAGGDTAADDGADENGIDPVDITATGVLSTTINLAVGAEPIDATGEAGKDKTSDNANDGNVNLTVDFGFRCGYEITGQVRFDRDGDGQLADQDPVVRNVLVRLYQDLNNNGALDLTGPAPDPLLDTRLTDENGAYAFGCLINGNYLVQEVDPQGSSSTGDKDGGAPNGDDRGQAPNDRNLVDVTIANADSKDNDFLDAIDPRGYIYESANGCLVTGGTISVSPSAGVTILLDGSSGEYAWITSDPGPTTYTMTYTPPANYILDPTRPPEAITLDPSGQPSPYAIGSGLNGSGKLADFSDPANPWYDKITLQTGDPEVIRDNIPLAHTKPDTWAEWQTANPLGGQNGPTQNADGDSWENVLEYALCLEPDTGVPSHDGFCVVVNTATTPDSFEAVITRPAGGLADVTYCVQARATLPTTGADTWTNLKVIGPGAAIPAGVTVTNIGGGLEEVRVADLTVIASTGDLLHGFEDAVAKGFVRLTVKLDHDANPNTPPETASSLVQGWKETAFEQMECATYSYPFMKKEALSGKIGGVSGSGITVNGVTTDLSTTLDLANKSYYLEVIADDNEGHRYDIIGAGPGGSLTLANDADLCAAPPYNTALGIAPTLSGDRFIVREHHTLGQMFPPSAFTPSSDPATADRILVYTGSSLMPWTVYYLHDVAPAGPSSGDKWVVDGDATLADQRKAILAPCQGFFVHPELGASPVASLAMGVVRENKFRCPLNPGYTLVAGGFPMNQSMIDRALDDPATVNGGLDPSKTDQVHFWRGDEAVYREAYVCYFYIEGFMAPYNNTWSDVNDVNLTPVDPTKLFLQDRAAFYYRTSAACRADYCVPLGWLPNAP